jgi:hypothetical protein
MKPFLMLSLRVAAMVIMVSHVVEAKPPTVKITIEGGDLFWPLEITDRQILDRNNIWLGRFLDGSRDTVTHAPHGIGRYEVSFFTDESYGLRKAFVLFYRPGRSGGQGYVYLPGPGDAWRVINAFSIVTGRDGRWSYASPEWEARIKPLIKRAEAEQRQRREALQAESDSSQRAALGSG